MEYLIYFAFAFALFYTAAWFNQAVAMIANSILGIPSRLSIGQIFWPTLGWTLFFYLLG